MKNREIPATHKVRIRSYGPGSNDCIIELDGKTLEGCMAFQFEMLPDELQTVTLKLVVNEIEIVSMDSEGKQTT